MAAHTFATTVTLSPFLTYFLPVPLDCFNMNTITSYYNYWNPYQATGKAFVKVMD